MNLKALSNKKLLELTRVLVERERNITLEVLENLQEIELRSLYAERGFSSLFDYAVKELNYSESAAQRRISAMRLLKAVPGAKLKVKEGKLSLSTLAQAQSFCRAEKIGDETTKKALLHSLEGKSSREVEKNLVSRAKNPQKLRSEKLRAVSTSLSEIRLLVDDNFVAMLDELRNLLGQHYGVAKISDILALTLQESVERRRPKAPKALPPKVSDAPLRSAPAVVPASTATRSPPRPAGESRYIPVEIRRAVWARDNGECTYQDPLTYKKCNSRYGLEFDHIMAYAKGGKSETNNLRLRCRAHNLLWAVQTYGQATMQKHVPRMRG